MTSESLGPRVLVVEDDRDVRETLVRILIDSGYDSQGANDGLVALELLRRPDGRRPALILLDLNMPVMDGREVCRELERDEQLRDIPVVLLSADLRPSVRRELPGPRAVLSKPLRMETLLDVVQAVAGQGARAPDGVLRPRS